MKQANGFRPSHPGNPLDTGWIVIAFAPPAWIAWLIWNAGPLPDNDYWDYLSTILRSEGFSHRVSDWFSHGTEHIVVVPKLIYALNVWLSGGDNRFLGLITFFFATVTAILLYQLARKDFSPREMGLATLTIALFVFTPRAVHNWMMGMSGIAWLGANLCAVGAFYLLSRRCLSGAYFMTCLGMLTYSTALAIWPALIAGAWLIKLPRQPLIRTLVLAILVIGLYLHQFHTPKGHPNLQTDAWVLVKYVLIFLGGPATVDQQWAMGLGTASLIATALILIRLGRQPTLWPQAAPWLMLQIYALGNGAMAAIARSGFGLGQALSSRYATLPSLFWLGLVFLGWISFRPVRHVKPMVLMTTVALGISSWLASSDRTHRFMERSSLKKLAMVSMYTGGYDFELLALAVTPSARSPTARGGAARLMHFLKTHHHVPFDGTFASCPRMGAGLEKPNRPASQTKLEGFFDEAREIAPQVIKARGWVFASDSEIQCIALVNQAGIVRGIAIMGFGRPDVAQAKHLSKATLGWEGYARWKPGDRWLSAWALNDHSWQPLHHRQKVARPSSHSSTITQPE